MIVAHILADTLTRLPRSAAANAQVACKMTDCSFCRLARGGKDEFASTTGCSPALAVAAAGNEFMVIMDSYPIGHQGGHVLIVPRRHHVSLSQVSDQQQLAATVEETASVMREMFPDHWLFTFEHGPGELAGQRVKCGGCHVDHAHGHILVLPKSVDFEDIRDAVESTLTQLGWDLDFQSGTSESPLTGLGEFAEDHPYLHIGQIGDERVSLVYRQEASSQPIPSQLLRRIVSEVSGKSAPIHWNWKIAVQQEITERLDRYRAEAFQFQSAFNELAT